MPESELYTVSEIVAMHPEHTYGRVSHAALKLGLEPVKRAGRTRLYDRAAVDRIMAELGTAEAIGAGAD